MAKKKLGRPPKKAQDLRGKPLPIRFTDEQRALIAEAARLAEERDTSSWARKILVQAARKEIAKHREQ
jgi:uncharacterized protein (DUF1778 family)